MKEPIAQEESIDDINANLDYVLSGDSEVQDGIDLEEDSVEDDELTEEEYDEVDDTLVGEGDLDDEDDTDLEEDDVDEDETDDEDNGDDDYEEEEDGVEEEYDDLEDEDDGALELESELLDTVVVDPKRGDTVSLRELFDQRFTRDDYRESATRWRQDIEQRLRGEYEPIKQMADERKQLEQEFVNLPVEYTLAAAQQAARLGIAPPQWPQMIEAARQKLVEAGLYNPEAAQARASNAISDLQRKEQEAAAREQQAQVWLNEEKAHFEQVVGVSFDDIPTRERNVIRAAFHAAEGSPRLADLYAEYFGVDHQQQVAKSPQPSNARSVKGGTGKKAPAASTSNRKLLKTLKDKNRKRSDSRGRSGGATAKGKGKSKKQSVESLSNDLDLALGL